MIPVNAPFRTSGLNGRSATVALSSLGAARPHLGRPATGGPFFVRLGTARYRATDA